MARDSRPPGYDMAYQPERPRRFGRSLRACLPAYGYLVACLGFAAFVAHGHAAPPGTSAAPTGHLRAPAGVRSDQGNTSAGSIVTSGNAISPSR